MTTYLHGSVEEYLRGLSGKQIVPGGGSASALTAALGAGLNSMAINFSIKDGIDEGLSSTLNNLKELQDDILSKITLQIDEDCVVFQNLMEAFSKNKDAQEEYLLAAKTPLNICRQCLASIKITKDLASVGNQNLITDIIGAAHLLKAAFYSAQLNVKVNLKYIKDPLFVSKTEEELESVQNEIDEIFNKIEE